MPSLQPRGKARISTKTAIIIGATIGGTYIIITLVLIHIFLQRRLKKKILAEAQRVIHTAHSHQSTLHFSFHEQFASPQSRGGESITSRARSQSDGRSYTRRLNHGSARSQGTLSTIRERPKTRRRGEYDNLDIEEADGEYDHDESFQSGSTRSRSASDSTVLRVRPHSLADNPFWMFDGQYTESSNSGSHHPRRHSYSTISTIRPVTRKSSGILIPTDVFVSEMNAKYPEASVRPTNSSKSMGLIRQVTRSPSPSLSGRPPSRSPSQIVLHEIQESEESFLPPVPLHPLIHKRSIDRIVSGQYGRPSTDSAKSRNAKAKGKQKAATSSEAEKENKKSGDIVRLGTVKRVRELVDVSLNGVGSRGHGRNKSLSAFNDLFSNMMGKRKSRASGDTDSTRRDDVEIRPSIESFTEKM